ncbi:MAG: iron-sulfur cluster assembly scaffold protein [Desulfobacterales bacterium]
MNNQKIAENQREPADDNLTFDFWHDHSEKFLQMALRGDYRERIEHPDAYGRRTGDCGDTVEFFLMIEHGIIKSVTFDIHGCINTNACANAVVELAKEKSLEEAWKIKPDHIEAFLETLPPGHKHCAELAAGAFYLALANYREIKKSPWKKMYYAR